MLPLSEPNKRGSTPENWSAVLDALKKTLAWFAAMSTGATLPTRIGPRAFTKLARSSPVTILFCTATRTEAAPATASAAKNEK
jgi:hypothetical protein